jgi:hypothetical protein
MNTGRKYPIPYNIYTLEQVTKLDLKDSPALIVHNRSAVQDSHVTEEELLSVPGIKQTKWKYIRTTHEWIPIFTYASEEPWQTYFDSEPYQSSFKKYEDDLWITPKGFPRKQD